MKIPRPIVIDFETEAIKRRPAYPPIPAGVSIKKPNWRRSQHYGWGYKSGNNCTKAKAQKILLGIWKSAKPLLFHHSKFDVDVAETHMGMPRLPWHRIHDTLFLLFFHSPHALSLSLKPAAAKLLKMSPKEQNTLRAWILAHVKEAKAKDWGAYIARAPGKMVGKYANGDVIRTERLFYKLYKYVVKHNMLPAYDRERKLMPILLDAEREGIRVDWARLAFDYVVYQGCMEMADSWLRKELKVKDLNLDSDKAVGNALHKQKIVTKWILTPKGQRSVARKNLTIPMFNNRQVALVLGYRNRLQTCISMFMETWLAMATESGGRIYTTWNQVRQSHGAEKLKGARTGRLSSTPPLMNVAKNFEDKDDGYVHPKFMRKLKPLPLMRQYLLPDKGELWGHRDYNQQELRLTAHFEDGELCAKYNNDPRYDMHADVQKLIKDTAHIDLNRVNTKILNFGDIYGMGLGKLAASMQCTVEIAKKVRNAKRAMMPGFAKLDNGIKQTGKAGLPIKTWGGREYYVEPEAYSERFKRRMSFEYKLLNYLIQGSAADVTKEAIIRYHANPGKRGRFLVTVHDEINISQRPKLMKKELAVLGKAMESIEVDVPMLSDAKVGENWGTLKKFEEERNEHKPNGRKNRTNS